MAESASEPDPADDADRLRTADDRLRHRHADPARLRRAGRRRADPVQCAPARRTRMRDQPHGALQTMVQRLNHTFDRALTVAALVVAAGRLRHANSRRRAAHAGTRAATPQTASADNRQPQTPYPSQPQPIPAPHACARTAASDAQPQAAIHRHAGAAGRSTTRRDRGRSAESDPDLERAIRIQPDSPQLWIELARAASEGRQPRPSRTVRPQSTAVHRQPLRPRTAGVGRHRRRARRETLEHVAPDSLIHP